MVNVIIEEPAFTIRITGGIGAQGSKGDPGNGIASAVLNDDYTLTLNFTDGTHYTTEPIRGAQGETGNGIASAVLNPDYTLTLYFTDGTHYTTTSIRGAQGERGEQGEKGDPGFSPIATVTKSGTVTTVSITDKNGTTTEDILDGAPGAQGAQGIPGVSPTIAVSDITGGHRITITDADHPQGVSIDVMDGQQGSPGEGVPSGGTTGQILKKSSGADYDTEWGEEAVSDVQLPDGTSIVNSQGVANIPNAGLNTFGVSKISESLGIGMSSTSGTLKTVCAQPSDIKAGTNFYKPIVSSNQEYFTFYGLAKAASDTTQSASSNQVGNYTDDAKSKIHEMLSGSITITGTTPTINALPGLRYICGEVSTLTVNLPASGCVDIQFESGSTPTVLTITPPSGVTVKWANGFDPTSLDANTTYEINIADGLGVCGSWT